MSHSPRWFRWFFLLWLGCLYLWGLTEIIAGTWKERTILCTKQHGNSSPLSACSAVSSLLQSLDTHLASVGLLALLICCSGIVFWISFSRKRGPLISWLLFPLQLLLAFGMTLVVQQNDLGLLLCLALTLQAIALLQRPRSISLASCGSFLLFLLILETRPQQWNTDWLFALPHPLWLPSVGDGFGVLALLLFLVGYFALHIQHIQAYTQLTATHQQLTATHAQLQLATTRIEELTKVTERQRLARDLHDTLVQGLASIVMQTQAAEAYLLTQHYARVSEIFQQMKASARETLATARAAIYDLRLMTTSEDLYEAMCGEIERLTLATNIQCLPSHLDLLTVLPASASEHVLSMMRESFTNIVKHASAQHVWIKLFHQQNLLTIDIQDDGRGFQPDEITNDAGHYGLLGLRERAHLLGGSYQISSAPGQGTHLRFSLPLRCRREGVHD
jgi:two-component system, NarL family, sensor histidine kinase YdfH